MSKRSESGFVLDFQTITTLLLENPGKEQASVYVGFYFGIFVSSISDATF